MLSIQNNQILLNEELIGYYNEYYYDLEGNVIADNELDFYWWVYDQVGCKKFVNHLDSVENQISKLIKTINAKLRANQAKVSKSNSGRSVGNPTTDTIA